MSTATRPISVFIVYKQNLPCPWWRLCCVECLMKKTWISLGNWFEPKTEAKAEVVSKTTTTTSAITLVREQNTDRRGWFALFGLDEATVHQHWHCAPALDVGKEEEERQVRRF